MEEGNGICQVAPGEPEDRDVFASIDSYLTAFAGDMARRVEFGLSALFEPETSEISQATRRCLDGSMKPYPAQAAAVEAAIRHLSRAKALWLVGEMGTGKCSANGTPVLTPNGWRPIEELRPGDAIVNPDGSHTTVAAVFPQGRKTSYRVHFSDGTHTDCCDEHIWTVNTPLRKWRGQPTIDLTLREIMDRGLKDAAGNRKWFIPMVTPADLRDPTGSSAVSPRELDPYVLGLLLGDGCLESHGLHFSSADTELLDAVRTLPCDVVHDGNYDWRLRTDRGTPNPVLESIQRMGLAGKRSWEKHVPRSYLWAPAADRLAILQGLLDTDGSVSKGIVEFTTTSRRLADDVRFLVESFGGTVAENSRQTTYRHLGLERRGRVSYRLHLALPPDIKPFRLERKARKYRTPTKYLPTRAIDRVETIGDQECTCIRVSHPNQLYIVNNFIVTHNTPIGGWTILAWEAHIGRRTRNVVTAPNHLIYKWRDHFHEIIPDCRVVIVKNFKDLLPLRREAERCTKTLTHADGSTSVQVNTRWSSPKTTEVYILPRDKGKLGYAWRASVGSRVRKNECEDPNSGQTFLQKTTEYICPGCGHPITNSNGTLVDVDYFMNGQGKLKVKRFCSRPFKDPDDKEVGVCGTPLWQAYNGKRGHCPKELPVPGVSPYRMAPCQFIRKIGIKFDLYLADEIHESKAQGSLQGQMVADLCRSSKKVVALTGTLVGGYADNLLFLLWRLWATKLMQDDQYYGHSGFSDFVNYYGVVQDRKRYIAEDEFTSTQDLIMGRGKKTSFYTKTLPGISPVLFTNFLLDSAVFIRLAEMHSHLPTFDERIHRVPMDEDVDMALHYMQKAFEEHREQHKPCRAWGGARAAFLRYPDKPWVDTYEVMDSDEHGNKFPAFTVPTLPRRERSKELRLKRLIRRNMMRGRKTWVFTELTGEDGLPAWDWMSWFVEYLSGHGIRAAVMRTEGGGGPKPEDREAWIAKMTPKVDVIVSHPTLVQTGLDLFDFPSIIFAFPGDNTYRLRQASRRAWRLGQTASCEVDYVVYRGDMARSMQDAALALMADKMAASLAIEGDFSSEGLAAMSGGDDINSQLAKFINGELDSLDSRDAFAKYRAKFEALMPQLGSDVHAGIEPDHPAPAPLIEREGPRKRVKAPAKKTTASPGMEPTDIPARKAQRRAALLQAVRENDYIRAFCQESPGTPIEMRERDGDRVLIGARWFQVVAKNRTTVRERNFASFYDDHPEGWVAFIEPDYEVGPTNGFVDVEHAGIRYIVSFMSVEDYLSGSRKPGLPT